MTAITVEDGKIVLRGGKVGTEQACCCCPPPYGCGLSAGVTPCVGWRGPYYTEEEAQQAGDDWVAENEAFFECAIRPVLEAAGYSRIQARGYVSIYEWCSACEGLCLDPVTGDPFEGPLYSVQADYGVHYDCGLCGSGTIDEEDQECGPDGCEAANPIQPSEDGMDLGLVCGFDNDPEYRFCVGRCNPLP